MSRKVFAICLFALLCGALTVPTLADPGRGSNVQCFAWAHQASPAINVPYNPSIPYAYNGVTRAAGITVTRTAVGAYTVTCRGVGGGAVLGGTSWGPGGHVQVTAYGGEDADHCKVVSWTTGGIDFSANVRCYNHAGALSDNRFDLLFVW
jgi:hypothetical protein